MKSFHETLLFRLRNVNIIPPIRVPNGAEGELTTRRVQKTFACPRLTASNSEHQLEQQGSELPRKLKQG